MIPTLKYYLQYDKCIRIQSNIDFVIDNKMNAALIHNVSQDNKEKYCQGKGKEFDTIT